MSSMYESGYEAGYKAGRADRDAEVAALLRPALDEALRPYLDLLFVPPAQSDTIIRGVASRLSHGLAQPEPTP